MENSKKTKKLNVIVRVLTVAFTASFAQISMAQDFDAAAAYENTMNHPRHAEFQEILDMYADAGAVGTAIAIASPEGIWVQAQGLRDFENSVALKADDLFWIGSITKVYTAVATLKLYEDGKLDLDDKIADYLPADITSNIANGETLTIRQLLNHTSGLVNYVMKTFPGWMDNSVQGLPAGENLAYIYGDPADFTPGEKFNYSNSNYLLLGMIIKQVTDADSAYGAITSVLLEPYGLTHTIADANVDTEVQGYMIPEEGDEGPQNGTLTAANAVGGIDLTDGGITGNALDVLRFTQLLNAGEIVSQETLAEMQDWVAPGYPDTEGMISLTGYGLGLTQISTNDMVGIGHYGSVVSFNSLVYYFPEIETTIVVLNSSNNGAITMVHMGNDIYTHLHD